MVASGRNFIIYDVSHFLFELKTGLGDVIYIVKESVFDCLLERAQLKTVMK